MCHALARNKLYHGLEVLHVLQKKQAVDAFRAQVHVNIRHKRQEEGRHRVVQEEGKGLEELVGVRVGVQNGHLDVFGQVRNAGAALLDESALRDPCGKPGHLACVCGGK